jgi:hypothetical protein
MRPLTEYQNQSGEFWAYARLFSERIGYSRQKAPIQYELAQAVDALQKIGLDIRRIVSAGKVTDFGQVVLDYLNARSSLLVRQVHPNLMSREEAQANFENLLARLAPTCPLPMNKQKGVMKHHNYLTCMVNILTEATLGGMEFDPDPHNLTIGVKDKMPVAVMSRRFDGAYPGVVNPVAIWEIKEYYDNKTFGSRIADGVYETLLDGFELAALREEYGVHIQHYLITDSYSTWWEGGGIPYLCRLIDALHIGLLDEVIFGREVLAKWPEIVRSWL